MGTTAVTPPLAVRWFSEQPMVIAPLGYATSMPHEGTLSANQNAGNSHLQNLLGPMHSRKTRSPANGV